MPALQGRRSVSNVVRVQSPSLPLSLPPIRLPSAPLLSPLALEVAPLIQLGGLGSAVSSHSGVNNDFGAFWGWRNAAGGVKDARFQTTENVFSLHFMKKFKELTYCLLSFCSQIIVRVQAIEDPHN